MSKYRIRCDVKTVNGEQSWIVEASSEKEALEKHERGESVFEYEEVEVTGLNDPVVEEAEDAEG
ncbi:MAG: hypothetical protein A4E57_04416 [Syntrophorhabdaceae bacterium PtaU1.Bin034]|nr:MAG: hypothetical protein A4E57_04416 [Syntrophorhabdaceae bacterium PtaU1.Bin034]